MKNKKVLAIVMVVVAAVSALVGCGSTGATAYKSGYRCDDGKKGRYHSGSSSDY